MTITRKFRSVTWAAAVASAALTCYLISYRVSAERTALEDVERDIESARSNILTLNTEFQTRSRMSQLERWNRRDLELGAPGPRQFIEDNAELASLLGRDLPDSADPIEVQNASSDADGDSNDNTIDEDVFETPNSDDGGQPRIQQATYIVGGQSAERARAERIAFLDERLRENIASDTQSETSAEPSEGNDED